MRFGRSISILQKMSVPTWRCSWSTFFSFRKFLFHSSWPFKIQFRSSFGATMDLSKSCLQLFQFVLQPLSHSSFAIDFYRFFQYLTRFLTFARFFATETISFFDFLFFVHPHLEMNRNFRFHFLRFDRIRFFFPSNFDLALFAQIVDCHRSHPLFLWPIF